MGMVDQPQPTNEEYNNNSKKQQLNSDEHSSSAKSLQELGLRHLQRQAAFEKLTKQVKTPNDSN